MAKLSGQLNDNDRTNKEDALRVKSKNHLSRYAGDDVPENQILASSFIESMHIAIAGNIGAGKSTLAQMLADHYRWEVMPEAADTNPYLKDFYEDMPRWSFQVQIYFLGSRFKQVLEIINSTQSLVQDRSIYEDAYIFARNLHTSGLMNDRDYSTYLQLFESITGLVKPPDLLIYLKADLTKLLERIKMRGREYEKNIDPAYLASLNDHYEQWIAGYDRGPLLVIDANPLDYVKRPNDFAYIVKQVDQKLSLQANQ